MKAAAVPSLVDGSVECVEDFHGGDGVLRAVLVEQSAVIVAAAALDVHGARLLVD